MAPHVDRFKDLVPRLFGLLDDVLILNAWILLLKQQLDDENNHQNQRGLTSNNICVLFSRLETFSKRYLTLPSTYLQHDRLLGGAGGGEVLQVPAALVEEGGPTGLVFPVPLDDVVAVEEVLLRRVAPESQEVTCLLHFLHQDVPRPSRYHTHVSVPCGNKGAKGGRVEVEVRGARVTAR